MSIIDNLTSKVPFLKPKAVTEYFFAINISPATLTTCVWTVEAGQLKILGLASGGYSSSEEIIEVADRLLDQSLGELQIEPDKVLFGVPDSWLLDDDLKEPYLKLLQNIVKSLSLKPMAYVATSHALTNFLEKKEGAPATAILVGIEKDFVAVTVARAGKVDGTKVVKRSDKLGEEVEKLLLSFNGIEVLPSRMLIYNPSSDPEVDLDKQKANLLSFPWMDRLSFLHIPKVEILEVGIAVSAISLAGASEVEPNVKYSLAQNVAGSNLKKIIDDESVSNKVETKAEESAEVVSGFMEGDVMASRPEQETESQETPTEEPETAVPAEDSTQAEPVDDYALPQRTNEMATRVPSEITPDNQLVGGSSRLAWLGSLTGLIRGRAGLLILPALVLGLILAYLFLPQAKVTVFVEPKVQNNDTQVTADPKISSIDEANKEIPGQEVATAVTGTGKAPATGTKKIGDPAKGSVVIYNKTTSPKNFSQGTVLTANNLKFTLDASVSAASESAVESGITFGKVTANVTASDIGADGNLPSGTEFTIDGNSSDQFSANASGNLSGGTSKDVTVVTDADQKKLLASLASSLRTQAQQKLQTQSPGKKVLEDGLSEQIVTQSYSKKVGDQAGDFSLNLTVKYSGIAYSEADLKTIVSKLVSVNIPDGYQLDLADTQTQADVSKIEKDKLVFLARFEAKLVPKIDTNALKQKIKGKTPTQAADILKSFDNVLSSQIEITPPLPAPLLRLPILERNIRVTVSIQ